MKNIVKLTCQHCGEQFSYEIKNGRGQRPKYCESCKKLLIRESKLRYEQKKKGQFKSSQVIVNTNKCKAENDYSEYVNRMLDLLGQLDTLRVNMCNLASELGEYQSNYDRKDQEFIHQVEINSFTNANEAFKFINDWHIDRTSRRNVKNLIKFLRDIIAEVPMKTKFSAFNMLQNTKSKEK